MNDLFEQLKAEPAINKYIREAPPPTPPKRLSQDKPTKSDKYAKPAKSSEKRDISPMKSDKYERSPTKLDKHERSPAKSDKHERTPLKSDKHERTPLKSDKREKTPVKSDKRERTPLKSDKHERTPLKSDKHERTPSKSDRHERSSKSDYEKSDRHNEKSPKKYDQHEKSSSQSPKKSDKHEKFSRNDNHEESPRKIDKQREKSPKKFDNKHDKSLTKPDKHPHPSPKAVDNKHEKHAKKLNKHSFGLETATSIRSSSCSSPRRDSMPPPRSAIVFKKPSCKSRSMSPPKPLIAGSPIRPFKVLIERKKLEDLMAQQAQAVQLAKKTSTSMRSPSSKEPETTKFMLSSRHRNSGSVDSSKSFSSKLNKSPVRAQTSSTSSTTSAAAKKMTPTKAQQKLFDPAVLKQVQKLKPPYALKRCVVRVQRSNYAVLQRKLANLNKAKKAPMPSPPKVAEKRKNNSASSSMSTPSPPKKGRLAKEAKPTPNFFIKLTSSPMSSRSKSLGKVEFNKKSSVIKEKEKSVKKSDHSKSSVKPTKFTRTSLIKNFGKRFFRSRVKIERCNHPLMRTFESNARARKLQAKGNKSKNLSVSFKEQVEIFGDSDSDSDSSDDSDPDFSIGSASTSKAAQSRAQAAAAAAASTPRPIAIPMPARLKKVENGKVIDDIEFDPSLFIDPRDAKASTPYISPVRRRKLEKKSYSPLKGDGTPSPRKEQLKLANERLPPSGLRRLNIDDVDDEDDDDCEYIVPIEIPQRRGSRASSTNAPPDTTALTAAATNGTNESPIPTSPVYDPIANDSNTTGSFASAHDQPETGEQIAFENIASSTMTEQNPSNDLPQLKRISPAPSLNSLRDLVDCVISSSDAQKNEAAAETNNDRAAAGATSVDAGNDGAADVDTTAAEIKEINKDLCATLDTDLSLQLFVEDSEIMADASNIVDGIVNSEIMNDESNIVDNIVNAEIMADANNIVDSIVKETIGDLAQEY